MQSIFSNAKAMLMHEPILQLDTIIDWRQTHEYLRPELCRELLRRGGRIPYDSRSMCRALLLAEWYGLSYPKLERALRLRRDFLLFCGFNADGKLPDSSTLNRFRMRLDADGLFQAILADINRQLKGNRVSIERTSGALQDIQLHRQIF